MRSQMFAPRCCRHHLLYHLSHDRRVWADLEGRCARTLLLGRTISMRFCTGKWVTHHRFFRHPDTASAVPTRSASFKVPTTAHHADPAKDPMLNEASAWVGGFIDLSRERLGDCLGGAPQPGRRGGTGTGANGESVPAVCDAQRGDAAHRGACR